MNAMFTIVLHGVQSFWLMAGEMAPYLLFGFLMAGVLRVLVKQEFVERHLGRRGFRQTLKATLIGVPMPLCSCGVIPVAAALRRDGAGKGATAAFLASTPQTGVDSILATWGLLGGVFALIRVAAAFFSGLVSGFLVDVFDHETDKGAPKVPPAPVEKEPVMLGALRHVFQYGFVTLPADIGKSLLIGLVAAGAISALIPADFFAGRLGNSLFTFPLITLFAVPMYVCSTGSIPMALALIHLGVSPGAALVFLIAGPATNAATISTLWKIVGRRTVLIYLISIIGTSWLFGILFNTFLYDVARQAACHAAGSGAAGIRGHIWAAVLGGVLIHALWPRKKKKTAFSTDAVEKDGVHRYHIQGMHCTHCAEQLQRALQNIPGVRAVDIDLSTGQAVVTGSEIEDLSVFSEVRKLGYEIAGMFSQN